MRDPLDLSATPERVRAAVMATGAPETAVRRAIAVADATPDAAAWGRFLSAAFLLLGAGLVLAGVISFFAFNWASLGRFGKLALLEAAVAACAIAGWRYLGTLTGRVALFAASVLVGPLLGVYGQTYQTGADPWGLFAAWAALILPWVVAARFSALWVLTLTLVDVALFLFWAQVMEAGPTAWMSVFLVTAMIHLAAVCAWEWQRALPAPWLDEAWAPRLAFATGFTSMLVPSVGLIVSFRDMQQTGLASLAMLLVAGAAAVWFYRMVRRDLFMLTAVAGSGLVMLSVLVGRVVFVDMPVTVFSPLFMAMFVIGEIGLAVVWLRHTLREWSES
jgi:uncharacterized membrane protein